MASKKKTAKKSAPAKSKKKASPKKKGKAVRAAVRPKKPAAKSAPAAKKKTAEKEQNYPGSLKDTQVQLTDGSTASLSSLAGPSGLVLYFYPKDDTPGCTIEACSFRDTSRALKEKGFNVAGVSGDSPQSHQKFTSKYSLNFPLISDIDHSLIRSAGAWQEKSMYGKTFMGIARITMVLDPGLKVRKVYPRVRPDGHGEQVLAEVSDL